ncbi:MAG TPA: hydantoinase/oxoprolinase family protein, partial [Solirubrobacteraceae bacterium]|nr:hydantoinase/oxoprolinase family protein [Solirubrobacteraceae bacterium]
MLRVGVDVGGTFTDLFAWDRDAPEADRVREAKVLTTPADPAVGVMNALEAAHIDPSTIVTIVHGTTIATNALIERRYREPALVTTNGFRDVLEIGRQRRRRLYDPYQVKVPPLIERSRRFTVGERMAADGTPVEPLDRDDARRVAEQIAAAGIDSVAVAFINAYRNGEHEEEMRDALLEVVPGAKIALSSQTRPKMRELGRFVTTAIRAALLPAVDEYLDNLQRRLEQAGCRAPLFIVKSNGGMMSGATARERPEELLESGPAGGVAAASYLSDLLRQPSLIVTDVGGTSFEASVMEEGQGLVTDEYEIEWERPVITPMLDIRSIGAGGGSIAWIDDGGSLRVGPQSAGADPGPACYGRGGTKPTVTDANLVMGRIDPTLGGKFTLDREAAATAIRTVADQLGMSVLECAEGITEIVSENMAAAIRMVSTDRGRDPRDHMLVAFGGAGGLHAHQIAQSVGVERVLVPRFSGVASAFGAITMDIRHDVEATFYAPTADVDVDALAAAFADLEHEVRTLLESDGVASADISLERAAQMRYVGQSYEVTTPVPDGALDADAVAGIAGAFHDVHEREYGVSSDTFAVAF